MSCDFRVAVEVTCEGCQETKTVRASYVDEMVKYKIVTGLDDLDIMQDVLAADKKRLDEVVTFIEGKESGKKGQKYLAGGAAVSKVSQIPPSASGGGGEKCKYCNRIGHGASPSEITRKASCPAWSRLSQVREEGTFQSSVQVRQGEAYQGHGLHRLRS